MHVKFDKMLETLIFQRSCTVIVSNTHPINRLSKAGAALENTIASILVVISIDFHLSTAKTVDSSSFFVFCIMLNGETGECCVASGGGGVCCHIWAI